MKIGLDCRFLNRAISKKPGGNTGHGVYIYNLIKYLSKIDNHNEYMLYLLNDCQYKPGSINFKVKRMPKLHNNGYIRSILTFPVEFWRNPIDIFHGMYSIPMFKMKKVVLTIFEFSWMLFPEYYPRWVRIPASVMTSSAVKRADKIISGSKFMKKEILDFFNVQNDRVEVIPLGVDEIFFERMEIADILDMKKRYKIDGEYILAVGDLWPKKNIERLIDAFSILRKSKNVDYKLVLTGGNLWKSQRLFQKVNSLGMIDNVIMTHYVSLRDLRLLYQDAQLFVFPSLYEGFGLPILEAMASQVPVAVSNISSMPEVAGDAGVYFDPYDIESIASSMLKVIEDSDIRTKIIKSGLERAKKFSWMKVSKKMLSVYQSIG